MIDYQIFFDVFKNYLYNETPLLSEIDLKEYQDSLINHLKELVLFGTELNKKHFQRYQNFKKNIIDKSSKAFILLKLFEQLDIFILKMDKEPYEVEIDDLLIIEV